MKKYLAHYNYFTHTYCVAQAEVEVDLHTDNYYWVSEVTFISGSKQAFNGIKDIKLTKIDSYRFTDTIEEAQTHLIEVAQKLIDKSERLIKKMKKIQRSMQDVVPD